MAGRARSAPRSEAGGADDARSEPSNAETAAAEDAGPGADILFAYQVLEDGGELVIRVGGSVVAGAVGELRRQLGTQQLGLGLLLSPLSSIGRLLSPAVDLAEPAQQLQRSASSTVPAARPDWLNQELAQSFEEFQEQVEEFRVALEEIRKERDDGAAERDAGADTAGQ